MMRPPRADRRQASVVCCGSPVQCRVRVGYAHAQRPRSCALLNAAGMCGPVQPQGQHESIAVGLLGEPCAGVRGHALYPAHVAMACKELPTCVTSGSAVRLGVAQYAWELVQQACRCAPLVQRLEGRGM